MKKKNYAALAVALVTGGLAADAEAGLFATPIQNGGFDYDFNKNPGSNGYDYQLRNWFRYAGGEIWQSQSNVAITFPGTFSNNAFAVLQGQPRGSSSVSSTTGQIYQQIGTTPAANTAISVSFLEAYVESSDNNLGSLTVSLFSGGTPQRTYSGYTGGYNTYGPTYTLTSAKLLASTTFSTPTSTDAFVQQIANFNTGTGGTTNAPLWVEFSVSPTTVYKDQIALDNVVVTGPSSTQLKWTGGTGAWNTGSSNWKNGSASTTYSDGSIVTFDDTATSSAISINSGNVSPTEVIFNNSTLNYTLSGTNGISGGAQLTKMGTGTLTITNANTFTGNVNLSAGVLNLQNSSAIGTATNVTVASGATLQLQGGINVATPGQVFLNGAGTGGTGTEGSLVNISGSNTFGASLDLDGSTTISVDSGSLNLNSTSDVMTGSDSSNFTLTLAGAGNGTIAGKVGGSLAVVKTGGGTWTLSSAAYLTNGITVSAGTLVLGGANTFGGGLTVNGGTAVITGQNNYSGGTTINGSGTLMLGDGTSGHDGGLLDGNGITDNGTVTFNTYSSQSNAQAISGTGVLNKTGPGTLTLSGTVEVGSINISAGKMYVGPTFLSPSTTISVGSGATLGGTGSVVDTVTVAPGGIIEAGQGGIGQLDINAGSLTFNGTGTINIGQLSTYTSSPAVHVSSTLTTAGANSITLSIGNFSGVTAGTAYELIGYGNEAGPGASSYVLSLPRGDTGSLSDTNNQIDLTLSSLGSAYYLLWTGAGNASHGWDTTTANWKYNGATPTDYIDNPGDPVLFDDTPGANQTVAINTATVHPASVTFNNSTYSYTVNGTYGIGGLTGITLNGTGKVSLNTPNTFSGLVTINAGTLSIASDANLGAAPATPTDTVIINGGTLAFSTSTSLSATRSIAVNGSGGTIDVGGNTVSITGAIDGTGNLSIISTGGAGTVNLSSQSASNAPALTDTGTLTIGSGVTANLGSPGNISVYSSEEFSSIIINAGATANLVETHTFGYGGGFRPNIVINGGTLNSPNNIDNYIGQVTMTGGTITGVKDLRLQSTSQSPTMATVTTLASSTQALISIPELNLRSNTLFTTASGSVPSGVDLLITSLVDGSDVSYGITKAGPGTMELTGANQYSGGTTVTAGTLIFGSSTAYPAATPLNISGGTTVALKHTGSVKNNIVASSLSFAGTTGSWTGQLDLTNNDMIVQGGSISNVFNQIAEGYNNGAWNGSAGIISSAAAADATHLHALGVISNDNGSGSPLYPTFDGTTSNDGDVLVKYTYYGDATLDGKVDGADYSRIDNGVLMGLTGWANGDFNYDGVINGSDYTLIDNAYNTQGALIQSEVASPTAQIAGGISAVPEPTTLGLLGLGAIGLLSRRKHRKN